MENFKIITVLGLSLVLVLLNTSTSSAANCKGCTPLDELNFDKIIKRFDAALVKFDTAYAYGDKHEEFGKVAKQSASAQEFPVLKLLADTTWCNTH